MRVYMGLNIMSLSPYVYHKVQSSGPKIKVHKGCIVICSIDSKFYSVRYSFFISYLLREVYCVHSVNFCPKTLFWDAKSEDWLYLGI